MDAVVGVQDGGGTAVYQGVFVCAGECDLFDCFGACNPVHYNARYVSVYLISLVFVNLLTLTIAGDKLRT